MLPTNWVYGSWPKSGEIDIMEYVGFDPGIVHGSIHTEDYNHIIGTQKPLHAQFPTPKQHSTCTPLNGPRRKSISM